MLTLNRAYPAWSAAHTPITPEQSSSSMPPSYPASAVSLDTYLHNHPPGSILSSATTQSPGTPLTAPPVTNRHQQYVFPTTTAAPPALAAPIRFPESNPRPAKSPRPNEPSELQSESYTTDYASRYAPPPYSSTASGPRVSRGPPEYFPAPLPVPLPTWTTAPSQAVLFGTAPQVLHAPPTTQSYDFPSDHHYVKQDRNSQSHQNHYTWNASS